MDEVNKFFSKEDLREEIARDVEIMYSDSAIVRVIIKSPVMKRYLERQQPIDEFPEGILVEFLDEHKNVSSWLEADYAIRKESEKKVYVENNVVLYNKKNDKLETDELIWDEGKREIYTDKFVRITQPERGDTSFGFGLFANQEFTRFEIRRKFSAIKSIEDLDVE